MNQHYFHHFINPSITTTLTLPYPYLVSSPAASPSGGQPHLSMRAAHGELNGSLVVREGGDAAGIRVFGALA